MLLAENNSVWSTHHGYLGFILDPEEIHLMPLRLDLEAFLLDCSKLNTFSEHGTYRRGILERP